MPTNRVTDVTIAIGQSISNVLKAREAYDDAFAIGLQRITAVDGAITYTIEVSHNPDAVTPDWDTLQMGDPFADAVPPAADKARTYYELPTYPAFRIKSSANATIATTWAVTKLYGTPGYPYMGQ